MKEDALAIVPLDIEKLEGIGIDLKRKLAADDKRRLMDILRKKMSENHSLLHAKREEVKEQIIADARAKAGLEAYRKEMEDIAAQIEVLTKKRDATSIRCQNATGFTTDGEMVDASYDYRKASAGRKDKAWLYRRAAGAKKAQALREKIDLAMKSVDRFALKFDKVETRLVLASTYGEAMQIMEAVLGNGDEILDAKESEVIDTTRA